MSWFDIGNASAAMPLREAGRSLSRIETSGHLTGQFGFGSQVGRRPATS